MYDASKYDENDPFTWDWADKPLTEDEKAMIPLRDHDNSVVANAFGYMVDNESTVDEYLEYLNDMDAQDFYKYYGLASLRDAKIILLEKGK